MPANGSANSGEASDKLPMVEPLALTDRGTAEEIAGRPDPDIEDAGRSPAAWKGEV